MGVSAGAGEVVLLARQDKTRQDEPDFAWSVSGKQLFFG